MPALTLYSFADVDRSGKVRWTAAELGLDVTEERLQLGQHRAEPYLSLNPYGQIPAVVLGGEPLIESTAIPLILAERHPAGGLIPNDESQRARFWQLLSLATTTLETPVVNYFLSQRGILDEAWQGLLEAPLTERLKVLAGGLPEEGYVCGRFSVADICCAYVLRIGVQAGLVRYEGALASWMDRLRARPAAVKARFFDSLDA